MQTQQHFNFWGNYLDVKLELLFKPQTLPDYLGMGCESLWTILKTLRFYKNKLMGLLFQILYNDIDIIYGRSFENVMANGLLFHSCFVGKKSQQSFFKHFDVPNDVKTFSND
jgi:hypothetical protein